MGTDRTPRHVRERREARRGALRALGFDSYPDYMRSAAWARKKRDYRESHLPQDCHLCGEGETVHLHHKTYERVGREDLTDLVPLCENCHALVHVLERRGDLGLDFDGLEDPERALQYAALREVPDTSALDEKRLYADIRSTSERLRTYGKSAARNRIDISANMAAIRATLASIEAKLAA